MKKLCLLLPLFLGISLVLTINLRAEETTGAAVTQPAQTTTSASVPENVETPCGVISSQQPTENKERPFKGKFKEKMLKKFDKNNDGKLDDAEKAEMKEALKKKKEKFQESMLKKYDTNHDGKLDASEKEAMKKELKEKRQKHRAEMLEKFDANHDGKLDATEREQARKYTKEKRAEHRAKKGKQPVTDLNSQPVNTSSSTSVTQ